MGISRGSVYNTIYRARLRLARMGIDINDWIEADERKTM